MKRIIRIFLFSSIVLTLASCGSEPPKVVQAVAPNYPQIARIAHVQGLVSITLEISSDGKVSNARMTSGAPLLRDECLATAKKWLFAPSSKQSRTVDLKFEFTVDDALPTDAQEQISFSPPYYVAIRVGPVVLNTSIGTVRNPKTK